MTESAQARLFAELARWAQPLRLVADDPVSARGEVFAALGWALDGQPTEVLEQLDEALGALATAAEVAGELAESPPESLEDLATALHSAAGLAGSLSDLPALLTRLPSELITDLPQRLLEHLTLRWLYSAHPLAAAVLEVLTLIEPGGQRPSEPELRDGARLMRISGSRARLALDQVGDLLRDPADHFRRYYLAPGTSGEWDSAAAAARLFPRLASLLRALHFNAWYPPPLAAGAPPEEGAFAARSVLTTGISGFDSASLIVSLAGPDAGDLGVVCAPFGMATRDFEARDWQVRVTVGVSVAGFAFGRNGLVLPAGDSGTVQVEVEAAKTSAASIPAVLVGSTTGTRLEIGSLTLGAAARLGDGTDDVALRVEIRTAAIVIAGGDGDGFLAQVLPAEGLRAAFELVVVWSRRTGLHVRGAAGLEATLPVHLDLGPLKVPSIFVRLSAGEDGIRVAAAATASVILGPVRATVERVGLEALVTFPPTGGNLGPAQLEPGFRPPDGAGLVIEAGPLVGGGYLFFRPAAGEYAGVLQLEFKGIALKAVGIITTRMPDGSEGFSLLLIISAEFTPIQLGYGFTLNGVGGLVGVNRTVVIDVLRAGIKTGVLNSIMFPTDPVANAPQLIADLSAVFPPAPGRFVIGPMARLGWGAPTLLTFDLGVILELPAPVRLAVMGRLRMALPRDESAIVEINMDVLGVVDFERGEVSIDASLYDSRIAGFTLTGDMALRAGWGDRPGFALAVGGFHPRFQPPPAFPKLARLALSLCTGDNPRLRLESYLALTSNSVQFGARLELYAAALGFSVEGMLAFDALFQFDPFLVLVDIAGSVSLKFGSRVLMAISVQLSLSGPSPWRAVGRARFQILFLSAEIGFDVRLGAGAPPPLPASTDVEALVEAALRDPRNWSAQLPPDGESLVTLREIPAATNMLLVHPLGVLALTQRVAPLGIELQRFGTSRVTGATTMSLGPLRVGATEAVTEPTEEYFAPAEFLDLTDDQKLSQPSFVRWVAGRRVMVAGVDRDTSPPVEAVLAPRTVVVDEPDGPVRKDLPVPVDPDTLRRTMAVGAAADALTRRTGPGRFAGPVLDLQVLG
ncbi:DUF6603 domain-containing protein [Modestobacter sp. I12A-02662]|uniref:DUF6603 domain-containing protein n=1 Tax=Modestobacter sp. I12A-02662 TaxID=1730496 RepID=UPI0034DEA0DC